MEIKYFKNLDGIRAIAVLMVMLSHFLTPLHSKFNILQQLLNKSSMLGQLGVSLFFVLSGFLITRILLNTKEKKQYFKNFYVRRILRIFPLYYLFLILFYYIFPFILDTEIPKFSQQLYYFTYLQNFAITFKWDSVGPIHFWSLAVEEHFYIFWPFIIYFFKDNKVIRIIILLIVSSL